MGKDFDKWSGCKKKVDCRKQPPYFHEREIWWCALGVNVGSEQDGTGDQFSRPVLIIKKFSRDVLLVVPLTKKSRTGKHYYALKPRKSVQSTVVLTQVRLVSSKRLLRRIPQRIGQRELDEVVAALFSLL